MSKNKIKNFNALIILTLIWGEYCIFYNRLQEDAIPLSDNPGYK
jgi:hypothetical protein